MNFQVNGQSPSLNSTKEAIESLNTLAININEHKVDSLRGIISHETFYNPEATLKEYKKVCLNGNENSAFDKELGMAQAKLLRALQSWESASEVYEIALEIIKVQKEKPSEFIGFFSAFFEDFTRASEIDHKTLQMQSLEKCFNNTIIYPKDILKIKPFFDPNFVSNLNEEAKNNLRIHLQNLVSSMAKYAATGPNAADEVRRLVLAIQKDYDIENSWFSDDITERLKKLTVRTMGQKFKDASEIFTVTLFAANDLAKQLMNGSKINLYYEIVECKPFINIENSYSKYSKHCPNKKDKEPIILQKTTALEDLFNNLCSYLETLNSQDARNIALQVLTHQWGPFIESKKEELKKFI